MRGMIQSPGWPVADVLIGPGTVIDFSEPQWAGKIPPINTQALDDECYLFMKRHYESVGWGHLMGGPPPSPAITITTRPTKSK
jgi:hypothetical protein